MKYIKTKDGIYERIIVVRQVCDGKEVAVIKPDKVEFELIIKSADTIEELCDEFVVAYEDGAKIVYGDLEWAKTKAKSSLEIGNKSIIYGAIWTDKGLIYVAKMNEKGELELL